MLLISYIIVCYKYVCHCQKYMMPGGCWTDEKVPSKLWGNKNHSNISDFLHRNGEPFMELLEFSEFILSPLLLPGWSHWITCLYPPFKYRWLTHLFCNHDLSLSSMLIFSMPTSHVQLDVPQSLQTQPALYYYFLKNKLPLVLSTLLLLNPPSLLLSIYSLRKIC